MERSRHRVTANPAAPADRFLRADYDLVPDLSCLGEDIVASFDELRATAAEL